MSSKRKKNVFEMKNLKNANKTKSNNFTSGQIHYEETKNRRRGDKKRSQLSGSRKRFPTSSRNEEYEEYFSKTKRTAGLEETYYGALESNQKNFEQVPYFKVACPICNNTFASNLALQLDLMYHVESANAQNILLCKFCLERFDDDAAINKHESFAHPMQTKVSEYPSFHCIICQNRFNSTESLEFHLRKEHLRLEMPYKCDGCGYRSSSHKDTIQHFFEKHDMTNLLQCPLCLMVIRLQEGPNVLHSNISEFFIHMQQHSIKSNNKKCNKCSLVFLHAGSLKYHQMYDHSSFFGSPGVKKLIKSTLQVVHPGSKQVSKEKTFYERIESFSHVKMLLKTGQLCAECDTELKEKNHIIGHLQCWKCRRYKTSCFKAMLNHTSNCCPDINPESNVHIFLDKEMHCVCGFLSSEGNSLARHLAACEHKSAYPSVEMAVENTVKRNMLDMLGLVRRDDDC